MLDPSPPDEATDPQLSEDAHAGVAAAGGDEAENQQSDDAADRHGEEASADDSWDSGGTRWLDRESAAFFASLLTHVGLILALAAVPIIHEITKPELIIRSAPPEEPMEELDLSTDIVFSDDPSEQIGAGSTSVGSVALSAAPELGEVSQIPTPQVTPVVNARFDLALDVTQAVGLTESDTVARGVAGYGVAGTEGAVDRITYEIIRSVEERPTMVVWLFDASVSLSKRRQEVRDRFDRIYDEVGIIIDRKKRSGSLKDEPLLTSVMSFGSKVEFLTDRPTADIDVIREAIEEIQLDVSGVEMIFSALYAAADRFKSMRIQRDGDPGRNVLLIAVTDERGDDTQGMDRTVELCRRYTIPVYIMGVPAPFGREFTYIKYVDPDPKFDQTPQWAQIDQGPETLMPERVKIGYKEDFFEEPIIDSGFGPFALSRICYETGGIFFTIHPNRSYGNDIGRGATQPFASHLKRFFDPEVMDRYRPDYVSVAEYRERLVESPLRAALVQASQLARTGVLDQPKRVFVKRDEAAFVRELTEAQQQSARLGPPLAALCQMLLQGEAGRELELSPRWLASYDLSLGTATAERVRNEAYNEMLAKAKRGMNFKDPKNNTWSLVPSDTIEVNSRLQREADEARKLFTKIVNEHAGTPWAYLARLQLERPIGWEWKESFTDLSPRPQMRPGNNNNVPTPRDDQRRMLGPQAPKRPIPKL